VLDVEDARLNAIVRDLVPSGRARYAPVDAVTDLLEARDVGGRCQCADPLQGARDALLHLCGFELGEELR
jgi:hypothetical protein